MSVAAATAPSPVVGVKMFLTSADRIALRAIGRSDADIDGMKPDEAARIIADAKARTVPAKTDPAEIVRAFNALIPQGDITEIRALDATTTADRYQQVYYGYFDDAVKAAAAVMSLRTYKAVYFVLNKINPALLARRVNRLAPAKKDPTTSDADIIRRRYLPIDTDPVRPSGISATDEEHEAALARADAIHDYLTSQGWPDAIRGDSSNGGHLLFCIDLPAEDGGTVEHCLNALAAMFDDDVVKVDTTVHNDSRIWKQYGTVGCKGDDAGGACGRPHRLARLIAVPDAPAIVTQEQLESLAAMAASEPVKESSKAKSGAQNSSTPIPTGSFDLAAWIKKVNLPVGDPQDWPTKTGIGTIWTSQTCWWNEAHTNGSAFVARHPNGAISAGCHHNGCKGQNWQTLRQKFEPGWQSFKPIDLFTGPPIPLDLQPPPAFPDDVLVGWFGRHASAVAAHTETPIELPALIGLAVLATACQGRFSVRPEAGYFEPLNIWVAGAYPPGTRKTAVVTAQSAPLIKWEIQHRAEMLPLIQRAETEDSIAQARIKTLKERASKEMDGATFSDLSRQVAEMEAALQPIPVSPRLLAQDITPEHTPTLMKLHNERLTILSDEGGILDVMNGRYSSGVPNLDVFLQGHSGSRCSIDRGSRPSQILEHPLLSIGLCPQPVVVESLVNNPTFRLRGLPARFLYAVPASRLGYRTLEPHPIPQSTTESYSEGIFDLLSTPLASTDDGVLHPHVLTFQPEAWRIWKDFQRRIENDMRPDGRMEHLTDWGGKLPGAVARLAGLLHCADWGSSTVNGLEIPADTMTRAVTLGEFFIGHAIAVFEGMDARGQLAIAKRLWREIEKARSERFTLRDIWHPLRGSYKRVADIEDGVAMLIDHNFIVEIPTKDENRAGRPKRMFCVNPAVLADWY